MFVKLKKAFYYAFAEQSKLKKNLRHGFVDEKLLETIMPNKRFPEYTLYLFALQC